jgi:hypothetical protein
MSFLVDGQVCDQDSDVLERGPGADPPAADSSSNRSTLHWRTKVWP